MSNNTIYSAQQSLYEGQVIFQEEGDWKTTDNYKAMSTKWFNVWSNLQDTAYFRNMTTRFLPMEPQETPQAYEIRLSRSFYNPLFKDGTRCLVSKPFGQELAIEDGTTDERLQRIKLNTDLMGASSSEFFKDVMLTGVRYGMAHVLVDMPPQEVLVSRAEERTIGAHPNLKIVNPYDLIWYDTANDPDGSVRLTEAHIKETRNIDGEQTLF